MLKIKVYLYWHENIAEMLSIDRLLATGAGDLLHMVCLNSIPSF